MIDTVGFKDSVQYILQSDSLGEVSIPEIINFEDGDRNIYERDNDSKGFFVARTNKMEFYGLGAETILKQVSTKGIAEDMLLRKRIKSDDREDELWRETVPVYLDLTSAQFKERSGGGLMCTVSAREGGLKKIIDSRKSDVIDLKSRFDSFGNSIPALSTETVELESREIFLESVLSVEDGVEIGVLASGDNLNARCFPFQVDKNSDQGNIDYALGDKLSAAGGNYADLSADKIGNCFLTSSDNVKRLTINGKVKVTLIDGGLFGDMQMDFIFYEGGSDFTYNDSRRIQLVAPKSVTLGSSMEYIFNDFIVDVKQGDSLAIGMLSTENGIRYEVSDTEITITEDSIYPQSEAKCLTYKQVINRLIYIITGVDNLLVSDLLTTGSLSEDTVSNGFWIRQFPDVVNEGTDEERKIQFNTSLEEIFDHIEALVPKAWWIAKQGTQDVLRLEEYSYTQKNLTLIPFGNKDSSGKIVYTEADDIKRKVIGSMYYGKLELGSEKGGDNYEEVVGLRSINGKATFFTINRNNDSVYSKLSPYRLGDVDVELPRRKPYNLYPDEDTRYDSDLMCIRTKKVGTKYYLKKWQDIFEQAPTGLYRVNSAFNLDLTPQRFVLSHGANINASLRNYPSESIIFQSSNCNSIFSSKKAGEDVVQEDQPIPHTRLDKATVRPMEVECTAQVTQEIEDYITGTTNGIQNWFGLVGIETGQGIEYFRMIKTDPNDEGKHKFIEANL